MEWTSKHANMEVDKAALNCSDKQETESKAVIPDTDYIPVQGSSRGYLLWKSLKNIRKYVSRVSEPLSKAKRRSLRRQLSFEVDDLERIVLGVKPRGEDDSDESDVSGDEEMRGEVEEIVKDLMCDSPSSGKVVSVDYFESRMKQVEEEFAGMKRKMEDMKNQLSEAKWKKMDSKAKTLHKLPAKSPSKSVISGYSSDDPGYEGSLDLVLEQGDGSRSKKNPSPCAVCGKIESLTGGWRCCSCRNFWNRLIKAHAKGRVLPRCNHWEQTIICKGCRRRKYELAMATHCPNSPLGLPPCPLPSPPMDPSPMKEESREIGIEYW